MSATVLVIDDQADNAANIGDILADQLRLCADVTTDPVEALEMIAQRLYPLVVLDLKMPAIDGVELFQRIRSVSLQTRGILVTAYADSSTEQRARAAGFVEILSKPVCVPQLLAIVARQLNLAEHYG